MEVRLQPGEDDVLSANQLSSGNVLKYIYDKIRTHDVGKPSCLAFFLFIKIIKNGNI